MEKVFFIINKYSGKGFQSGIEGRIIDRCAQLGLEATIEYTQLKGHATELASQAVKDGFPRVFAMGGDGTVNEVAQALVHTSAVMGILPSGSGNGLARHLQIPLKISLALGLLGEHKIIEMDTLLINGRVSANVSGIGFDGHVAGKFGENGRRGLRGYTKLVLQEFRRFREFDVKATLDGEPWEQKSFILALANSSQFGNNARVAPRASVIDGLMDVCFIRKVPLTQVVGFTTKMFTGRVESSRFVKIKKAVEFEAEFLNPLPYHIDGEPHAPASKFKVEVQPKSLKVMVPVLVKRRF